MSGPGVRLRPGAMALLPALGACAMAGGVAEPVPPGPLPAPTLEVVALEPAGPPPPEMPPPPATVVATAADVLGEEWTRHPWMEAEAEVWIRRWHGSRGFGRYLQRMGRYESFVDSVLDARGLPPALRYLPVIESGYHPGAVSRVGAMGLWQLMPATARLLGLEVNVVIDERRDPFRATDAALDYLEELHARFGSWPLALAAYNGGPGRVDRLLRTHAAGSLPGDSLYWVILPHLPAETRAFVPKFLAAARIASDPATHGLGAVDRGAPLGFDRVEVPDATTLDVVARAAGVSLDEVVELNGHLVRGLTPAGVRTPLRVPEGRGAAFAEAYARIPPEERVTTLEHRVRSGETLGHIAVRYGVSVGDLRAANPRVEPRRLQLGQRLLIVRGPDTSEETWQAMIRAAAGGGTGEAAGGEAPPARASERADGPSSGPASSDAGGPGAIPDEVEGPEPRGAWDGRHVVGEGESLWTIARRYWVTVEELRAWNRLGEGAVLHPGDELEVRAIGLVPHRVAAGETLSGIAGRHGVALGDLARWNGLTPAASLRVGEEIRVPGGEVRY